MSFPLLVELFRVTQGGEAPLLAHFTTTAFAEILRTCPGLAARLFGDLGPIPERPVVQTGVQATADTRLDLVIEGEGGFHLLLENRLSPETDWFEERSETRLPVHTDKYVAAARHRYAGSARVLVLARSHPDFSGRRYPSPIFCGSRTWPTLYAQLESSIGDSSGIPGFQIQQFLYFLKEHDMNPSEPISAKDADTIISFDRFARNNLKVLDEAIGRIRQEFDLKSTPNNRRMTGWYVCSDRFQSDELHFFFYVMFPPVPDLVVRAAVQVTKESSPRGFAAAAEHGFRRGRWGSLWVERDYRRNHPLFSVPAGRQVEEMVRFFQTPLGRLAKAGLVKLAPTRHEEPSPRQAPAEAAPGAQADAGAAALPAEPAHTEPMQQIQEPAQPPASYAAPDAEPSHPDQSHNEDEPHHDDPSGGADSQN